MASIQARKRDNSLIIDFYFKGTRCREQTALEDNAANRKKVQKVLDRIEAEIAAGTFEYKKYFPGSKQAAKFDVQPEEQSNLVALKSENQLTSAALTGLGSPALTGVGGTPLLSVFAETWYSEKEIEWRRSHRFTVKTIMDTRIIPKWGDKEVGRITKADILAYRAELGKVQARGKKTMLSNRRINKIIGVLRQIINEAADRYDFRTPFQNIKQLKIQRIDVDPFTLDEVMKIIETVRADFKSYYTVRFFTGMRTSEVDGLKWKFVDFEKRLILIRETFVLGEVEYTKNDGSQRDIKMSQVVYDALKAEEKETRHRSEYVFCTRTNTPLVNKNVTDRVWRPLLRHLGLKVRRAYQTRHTAATLWLGAGENPEWIAKQMGHTTTEMLFRVYSRFVPNLTRQDGSAFERLLMQSGASVGQVDAGITAGNEADNHKQNVKQVEEVAHVQ